MKPSTLAIAALIAAVAPTAFASSASEREYQRGYNDCSQGRYDQNQHGESYKKGCRAAEDGQKAQTPAGHQGSTVAEREYKRGFDDCSHGRYDQNQHGESYKKGCRAAEDGQKAHAPAGHEGGKAKLSDLKGMDSIKAFDVMTARGFTSVDSLTSGDILYGIYYNAKTHQCVQLANVHDRVDSAVDIHTHPKCK
jgi:hypothetical protein